MRATLPQLILTLILEIVLSCQYQAPVGRQQDPGLDLGRLLQLDSNPLDHSRLLGLASGRHRKELRP